MKLRQKPEDFIVEEINDCTISQNKQAYRLYTVQKRGVEAFSLFSWIAKQNNIPIHEIGTAGLKDKHALTTQYLTIPAKYEITSCKDANIAITFLGYVQKPLEQGDLLGNKFTLTARAITKGELSVIANRAESAKKYGVPNYFDSQRFGSVIGGEFIAKHIMLGDFQTAVKIYLTTYTKSEKKSIKDEKRTLHNHWPNLHHVQVKTPALQSIVKAYLKNKNWQEAYKAIPEHLRSLYLYAYQSYLWNECVKELLKTTVSKKKLYTVEYSVGKLIYYKELNDQEKQNIPLTFTTIDENISKNKDDFIIIKKILDREGLTLENFNLKKITGNYLKAAPRPVISTPQDFSLSPPEQDELNKNRFKIVLKFSLEKGSYATIVTKKVFGH